MSTINTAETLVGGAVLACAVTFAIYAGQIVGVGGGDETYPLTASFRSLEGISVGTDVRLAGVRIGTVTDIALDAETYRAVTTFGITGGVGIPDDSAVAISSEGLLGGSFVEILPGGSPFSFTPGDEISDTQSAVSLLTLLARFVAGGASE